MVYLGVFNRRLNTAIIIAITNDLEIQLNHDIVGGCVFGMGGGIECVSE